MIKAKKPKKPADKIQVHFVFIEEPFDKVAPELMKWEESSWWPKNAGIAVVRSPSGPIQVGTIFQYKLGARGWTSEVVRFSPNRLLASTFKSGLLQGAEAISIEERANGTRVEYEIRYQIKNLVDKIIWMFVGERVYSKAMKKILAAFRNYMIEKSKQEHEKKLEEPS